MPRHVYRCPLRWSDMDAYGHVNNGVFVTLLEEARVDLLLSAAGDSGKYMLDTGVLVKRHEVDYKAPLSHRPEPVTIELWTEQIRPASFVVGYEVKDDVVGDAAPVVYATAKSLLVSFDVERGAIRRLTPGELEWLQHFHEPQTS